MRGSIFLFFFLVANAGLPGLFFTHGLNFTLIGQAAYSLSAQSPSKKGLQCAYVYARVPRIKLVFLPRRYPAQQPSVRADYYGRP